MSTQTQTKPRFPIPRYPTGWFQVAYADEIAVGEAKPLKYFGQDLVIFRTESGVITVLDAFCPHLGAHLGHGGKVKGEEIECPFHAWRFTCEGACAAVPYAKRIPAKASIPKWHAVERNACIYVWNDVDNREPFFDVPTFEEIGHEEWSEPVRREWKLRTHNQEMAENVVDSAHFKYVHGTDMPPASVIESNGVHLHMLSPTSVAGLKGSIESNSWGFGISTTRFKGLAETFLMGNVCPIDDEYVHVRFTFVVKKAGGADVTKGIGRAFVKEVARQLEQDAPIWENKVHHDRPLLCDGDGEIGLFRRWSRQFYPDWYWEEAQKASAEAAE